MGPSKVGHFYWRPDPGSRALLGLGQGRILCTNSSRELRSVAGRLPAGAPNTRRPLSARPDGRHVATFTIEVHAPRCMPARGLSGSCQERGNHGAAHFDNQHVSSWSASMNPLPMKAAPGNASGGPAVCQTVTAAQARHLEPL
jgi:hypothetical protein